MKLTEGAKLALLDELLFISQLHHVSVWISFQTQFHVYRFPPGQGANV